MFTRIFIAVTEVHVVKPHVRPRSRWQAVATCLLVLAGVSFVSGFIVSRPFITQSEVPTNFRAEQKGDRFFAVKHRGGENPPAFEIDENQYRLWKQGETIHGLFHLGSCCLFLAAWSIFAATSSKARSGRRPEPATK